MTHRPYALPPLSEDESSSSAVDAELLAQREERAYERLAQDEMLTADLTDDVAIELLSWVREKVHTWVVTTAGLDEASAWARLDDQLQQLRCRLRRIVRISASSAHPQTALKAQLTALDGESPYNVAS